MARRAGLWRGTRWGAAVLFTGLFVASLRWAFVVSLSSEAAVHIAGGGVMLQSRVPVAAPSTIPGVKAAPVYSSARAPYRAFYVYRHGFPLQVWYESYTFPTGSSRSWTVPLWPVFAAWGVWWGTRVARRWLARKPWECAGCGYDLRGLSAGVCPECGRLPTLV